jgi:hypothetical protein
MTLHPLTARLTTAPAPVAVNRRLSTCFPPFESSPAAPYRRAAGGRTGRQPNRSPPVTLADKPGPSPCRTSPTPSLPQCADT